MSVGRRKTERFKNISYVVIDALYAGERTTTDEYRVRKLIILFY